MTAVAFWWVQTGSVATYEGSGAYGDVWADPVDVSCLAEGEQRLVTNAQGDEVVSMTVVRGPLTDKDKFKPGSKFTLNGHTSRVITIAWFDSGSIDIGLDHYEAHLT